MYRNKILHSHLSSHSALEVNSTKYILILKYSVSILQCISKVLFVPCKKESELKKWCVLGLNPMGIVPWLVDCSFFQAEPLLSCKGFPWGQKSRSPGRKLIPLGPWLQASPLYNGSRFCHCLGWKKKNEIMRGCQDPCSCLESRQWACLCTHDRGWQTG